MAAKLKDDPAVQALVEKAQAARTRFTLVIVNTVLKQCFADALLTAKGDKAATAGIKMLQNNIKAALKTATEAE